MKRSCLLLSKSWGRGKMLKNIYGCMPQLFTRCFILPYKARIWHHLTNTSVCHRHWKIIFQIIALLCLFMLTVSIMQYNYAVGEVRRVAIMRNFQHRGQEPSKDNRTDYEILIVTPFSDTMNRLRYYLELLNTLSYPHHRISIALGHDSGFARKKEADKILNEFQHLFREIKFLVLQKDKNVVGHHVRHNGHRQPVRRHHMALSRNELLFRALRDEHDRVIWIDVDMEYIPPNLIQLLLSPNQPIVAPVCAINKPYDTYDRNTWRETNKSRAHIEQQKAKYGDDFVMIEPSITLRKHLAALRDEGAVVQLDGIGGCALLVNASCHRQGLIFPTFSFDSHVETEGLAKMATKMGIPLHGLPNVQVFHDMRNLYIEV